MVTFLVIGAILIPFSSILYGITWRRRPPKNREGMWGYRTAISIKNQDTWEYAHRYYGGLECIAGIFLEGVTIVFLIYMKGRSDFQTQILLLLLFQAVVRLLIYIPTEMKLKKVFDENGERR